MSILVGQRIKALREARGWSQEDLASRTGINPAAVSWLETAALHVFTPHLTAIVKALGVTADALLSGTQGPISEDQGAYAVDPAPVRLCVNCAHYRQNGQVTRYVLRHLCVHPALASRITGKALPCDRHQDSLCGREGKYFTLITVAGMGSIPARAP
jgi:DNA-binding XRE family transcriptional regulator